jgi:hypothetical protein
VETNCYGELCARSVGIRASQCCDNNPQRVNENKTSPMTISKKLSAIGDMLHLNRGPVL